MRRLLKAEQRVPNFLKCVSYELKPNGTSGALVKQHTVDNSFSQTTTGYPLARTFRSESAGLP